MKVLVSKFSLKVVLLICFVLQSANSQCNDWQAFKDTKCFKIIENVGLLTYDDAVTTCHQQSNESNLITINSTDELHFLINSIFNENKIVDNVWIGAKYIDSHYRWLNGLNLTFTNWSEGFPKNLTDSCVEITSDPGSVGKWIDVSCKRRNLVVCEKKQSWSMSSFQEIILSLRDLVLKQDETISLLKKNNTTLYESVVSLQQNIISLQESVSALKQNNSILQQNSIPIGFIYIQLPNEKTPKEIWPLITWNDITSSYAGLFFRAFGGNSSSFGSTQEENAPRITDIESQTRSSHNIYASTTTLSIGEWSKWLGTGGYDGPWYDSRFFTSGGEVRPRNTAIRIWKRYQ